VINMCQQSNSYILKNLYQAKQINLMNKKKKNITLVQHLWLANNEDIIN
jgi:hypothetical protein